MKRKNMTMRLCAMLMLCTLVHLSSLAATLSATSVTGSVGQDAELAISLDNADMEVVAMQMDIALPAAIAVADNSQGKPSFALTSRCSAHTLAVNKVGDNAYRIVVYSTRNTAVSGQSGAVITCRLLLDGGADGNVSITGIRVTDKQMAEHSLADVKAPVHVTVPHPSATITVSGGIEGQLLPLQVSLDDDDAQIVAFQFDLLNVPGALDLQLAGRANGLTLGVNKITNGYRVAAYSATNKALTGDAGAIVTGSLKVDKIGTYKVELTNFKVTDAGLREYSVDAASAEFKVETSFVPVKEVQLSSSSLELQLGQSRQLTATVLPEDATDKTVIWSTSDASVATVSESGMVKALSLGTAHITVKSGEVTATCEVTVLPIPSESVTLDKTSISLYVGGTETIKATVLPENATDKTVKWSSSDTSVATVDANGNVTAVKIGNATITATNGGKRATCEVSVIATPSESVTLDKTSISLYVGGTETIKATVLPENATDKTVKWSSSDASVAKVDANGKVTALKIGTATITATNGGNRATCEVSVIATPSEGVVLDKTSISLYVGGTETIKATVLPENATDKAVKWSSSDTSVATVDSNGKVTAVNVGKATITATNAGNRATCEVTVMPIPSESVILDKTSISLYVGGYQYLAATILPANTTDKKVIWESSDTTVATVDLGKVTAVKIGHATITATNGSNSASCEVSVIPTPSQSVELDKTSLSLRIGDKETLTATVLPEDVTDKTLVWASTNEAVAAVNQNGEVTAIAPGTATITATNGEKSASCRVTVTELGECEQPSVEYNGRYLSLSTSTPGASIHYTVDGTDPTQESAVYESTIDTHGIVTVKAAAFKQDYKTSPVTEYTTAAYSNDAMAIVAVPGSLSTAFGWTDAKAYTEISIEGELDSEDITYIRSMNGLRTLYLDEAHIQALPDGAFASMQLIYARLPRSVQSAGSGIFRGCDSLCAIAWLSESKLDISALQGISNCNLLLYVDSAAAAPDGFVNVITGDKAYEIVLSDGGNFYCPQEFMAIHISYTHGYDQTTPLGGCAGWETISLPFDVQKVMHGHKGEIKPFASLRDIEDSEYKPFWLYGFGSNGFEASEKIEAYTPYIISMPNNEAYPESYDLSGSVTFESAYCYVMPNEARVGSNGTVSFVPTMTKVASSDDIYALNVNRQIGFNPPGSWFVRNYADINPFEAYITLGSQMHKPEYIRVSDLIGSEESGIYSALTDGLWSVESRGGNLYITSGISKPIRVYTIGGMLVRQIEVAPGVTVVSDLPDGIYVIEGAKIYHRK